MTAQYSDAGLLHYIKGELDALTKDLPSERLSLLRDLVKSHIAARKVDVPKSTEHPRCRCTVYQTHGYCLHTGADPRIPIKDQVPPWQRATTQVTTETTTTASR